MSLAHLLYKAIYHWSLQNDSRYLVTIIEQRYFIYLKRFFPFVPLADFKPLGEGVMSGIALLDWREFEESRGRRKGRASSSGCLIEAALFHQDRDCMGLVDGLELPLDVLNVELHGPLAYVEYH